MFVFEGFVIGLLGSLHCLGMCGPLVLALPLGHTTNLHRIIGGLLYNLGRAVTYGLLGIVFGILGRGLKLSGLQQWVSIIFGVILILAVIVPGLLKITPMVSRFTNMFSAPLKNKMGNLLRQKKIYPLFVFGLLNGLLPCGLVYGAIFGAIISNSLVDSSLYMFLFGLGTLPMMFLLIYFSDLIKNKFLKNLRAIIPVFVVLLGILFILRGLNLGIPYLSPDMKNSKHMMHHQGMDENAPSRDCCNKSN